jgi:hypothetical protein
MKTKSIIIKSDAQFKKMVDGIKLKLVQSGRSNKMVSTARITLAISRVPNISDIIVNNINMGENLP